jgi:hypothetical protein
MTTIKLSGRTLDILKNFSTINQSMVFKPGHDISTLSHGRKILARATIEQEFENTFGIYELSKFFGAISLFKDPTITTDKHFLNISEGTRSLRYVTAYPEDITAPSDDAIKELPSVDVEFDLTDRMLKDALKAAGVLSQPDIVFTGDGTKVMISTQNIAKPTNESYSEDVGAFTGDNPFNFVLKVENLKLFPGDYIVRLSFQKISQFVGKDVSYIIAVEANSTFVK